MLPVAGANGGLTATGTVPVAGDIGTGDKVMGPAGVLREGVAAGGVVTVGVEVVGVVVGVNALGDVGAAGGLPVGVGLAGGKRPLELLGASSLLGGEGIAGRVAELGE